MDEDQYRRLVASNAAHAMLVEFLLRVAFKDLDAEGIAGIAEVLKGKARATDHFTGVTKGDEARSERLADMVILMQEHAAKLIDSAAQAATDVAKNRDALRR